MCKLCNKIGQAIVLDGDELTEPVTDEYHQCEYAYISDVFRYYTLDVNQEDGDGEPQNTCMRIKYCPECGRELANHAKET
jgi:hypothetical protein